METKYTSAKNKNGKQNLPVISYGISRNLPRIFSVLQQINMMLMFKVKANNQNKLGQTCFSRKLAIFSRIFSRNLPRMFSVLQQINIILMFKVKANNQNKRGQTCFSRKFS